MARAPKLLLLGLAAIVAGCASTSGGAGSAKLAPWDQARVTAIAQQLATACDAWHVALLKQPGGATLGSGFSKDFLQMQQESVFLQQQSASLAAHLKAGKGYDQTVHEYQALKEGFDDAQVDESLAFLDEPTQAAGKKLSDLMHQIAPYYDPRAKWWPAGD